MTNQTMLKDILDIVTFIRDTAATKQDLHDVRTELKSEIQDVRTELKNEIQQVRTELKNEVKDVRNEMIDHVDGFIGLHNNLDTELTAVRVQTMRNQNQIQQIARHVKLKLT